MSNSSIHTTSFPTLPLSLRFGHLLLSKFKVQQSTTIANFKQSQKFPLQLPILPKGLKNENDKQIIERYKKSIKILKEEWTAQSRIFQQIQAENYSLRNQNQQLILKIESMAKVDQSTLLKDQSLLTFMAKSSGIHYELVTYFLKKEREKNEKYEEELQECQRQIQTLKETIEKSLKKQPISFKQNKFVNLSQPKALLPNQKKAPPCFKQYKQSPNHQAAQISPHSNSGISTDYSFSSEVQTTKSTITSPNDPREVFYNKKEEQHNEFKKLSFEEYGKSNSNSELLKQQLSPISQEKEDFSLFEYSPATPEKYKNQTSNKEQHEEVLNQENSLLSNEQSNIETTLSLISFSELDDNETCKENASNLIKKEFSPNKIIQTNENEEFYKLTKDHKRTQSLPSNFKVTNHSQISCHKRTGTAVFQNLKKIIKGVTTSELFPDERIFQDPKKIIQEKSLEDQSQRSLKHSSSKSSLIIFNEESQQNDSNEKQNMIKQPFKLFQDYQQQQSSPCKIIKRESIPQPIKLLSERNHYSQSIPHILGFAQKRIPKKLNQRNSLLAVTDNGMLDMEFGSLVRQPYLNKSYQSIAGRKSFTNEK